MDTRTIGGRYVTAALAGARRKGRDPRMFLRDAGIPVGLLDDPLAERLGFSEASAFHRAFKRWTGTTPGSYRESADATG